MPKRIAASFAFVLLTPSVALATAPNFNCKFASTQTERIICGSDTLSELDHELGVLYRQASARSVPAQLVSLRYQQRSWLSSRDMLCAGLYQAPPPAAERCLTIEYHRRLDVLNSYIGQVGQQQPTSPQGLSRPADNEASAGMTMEPSRPEGGDLDDTPQLRRQAEQIESKPDLDQNEIDTLQRIHDQLAQTPPAKGDELFSSNLMASIGQRIYQASEELRRKERAASDDAERQEMLAQRQRDAQLAAEHARVEAEAEARREAAQKTAQNNLENAQLEKIQRAEQDSQVLLTKYGDLGPSRKFLGGPVQTVFGPFPMTVIQVFHCLIGQNAFHMDQGAWVLTNNRRTPGSDTTDKMSLVFEHQPDDTFMLTHIFADGEDTAPREIIPVLLTIQHIPCDHG